MAGDRDPRVPFPVAGRAMRQARARAVAARASLLEQAVLAVVIELTGSWSRLVESRTSVRQIGALAYGVDVDDLTGHQRDRIAACLRHLRELGVITYESKRGRFAGAIVGIPPVPEDATNPARSRRIAEGQSSADAGSIQRDRAGEYGCPAGSTEKGSEKLSPRAPSAPERLVQRLAKVAGSDFTELECRQTITMLSAEGIADLTIDEVIGYTELLDKPPQKPLGYVVTTARDWHQQRVGAA